MVATLLPRAAARGNALRTMLDHASACGRKATRILLRGLPRDCNAKGAA